jgi:lysophospholipase L1-like esterase
MAGTNNISQRRMTGCTVFAGVKKVIETVRNIWPHSEIYAFGILPRGADFKEFDNQRTDFNERLGAYIRKIGGVYVQIDDQKFTCGGYARAPLPNNTLNCAPNPAYDCHNYTADHVHLNQPGYDALYTALSERLSRK